MDLIIDLFKYYSRFVPKEALKKIFIQPEQTRKNGYPEIETEVLSFPGTNVIEEIGTFIVSVNEDFLSERMKNAARFILFVEYGKFSITHGISNGALESLSITVAHNLSKNNNDNLNEIILMNDCFKILDTIIRQMKEDQEMLDFCGDSELIKYPVEYQVVDPVVFYGCGGWAAMFQNSNTIL